MKEMFKKINMKETRSFVIMIVTIFAFRSMLFEPFRIPSGSMIPTLNIGDFILVNKFTYGIKVPFSDMFSDPIYMSKFEAPKRDDVIVFKYPVDTSQNFIKRVIGVPGDEVELINKQVFVNGKMVSGISDSSPVTKAFANSFDGVKVNFFKVAESGKEFDIQMTDRETQKDTVPKFTVPEGNFFVMGDNRDFSADSRYWGFVPKENIKGKALIVWMSLTLPGIDQNLSFSPSRIGKRIF
ncbi:MAG: signal peptidase I [Bacteriovorax sp.]|nr:signal peptidase I [Bacteriovorax sp.]